MKKFFPIIIFLLYALSLNAQELYQVKFSQMKDFTYFSFLSDREIHLRVSDEGKLLEYGIEQQSIRNNNYYSPQLQPYVGPVEYYGAEADSAYRGKIRRIGSSALTYYGSYEVDTRRGKLKSIGSILLDYYSVPDKSLNGKIKSIGSNMITFYSSFENEAIRGNLKSVGNTQINYYSTFDDRILIGKVKSIGSLSYTYYSSFDRREYRGTLKTGAQRSEVAGIMYVLW